ncbi:uncharacterized protein [Bactrocera oleae]|uniref:uncharacterized protein isoform X4 n=1 Tax=Bactrocera oleae TaxID=104688 RepID=UPI00387E99F9
MQVTNSGENNKTTLMYNVDNLSDILSLSIRNIILLRQLKYEARLRAQSSGNASPPADGSCTENAAPRCDNPPTYESAMANYLDAKQQLREMEEGALAGANAMTASTTTIETCISNVGQSHTDLRTTINDAAPTGSESPRQPLQ